jgi:hypothetical protein
MACRDKATQRLIGPWQIQQDPTTLPSENMQTRLDRPQPVAADGQIDGSSVAAQLRQRRHLPRRPQFRRRHGPHAGRILGAQASILFCCRALSEQIDLGQQTEAFAMPAPERGHLLAKKLGEIQSPEIRLNVAGQQGHFVALVITRSMPALAMKPPYRSSSSEASWNATSNRSSISWGSAST